MSRFKFIKKQLQKRIKCFGRHLNFHQDNENSVYLAQGVQA